MSSDDKDSNVNNITSKIGNMNMNPNNINKSDDFYQKPNCKVGYARLEKGLLLFVYIYETNPIEVLREKCKNQKICYYTLTDQPCPNQGDTCTLDHEEKYRQPNLCKKWYENKNKCSSKDNTCGEHEFKFYDVAKTSIIINDTDQAVYDLLRFIRNFASHFVPSKVDKKLIQSLYKEVIILMVHIIGCTAKKVAQMNLFLHKFTINQLKTNFLEMLNDETAYDVPSVFLHTDSINYKEHWFQNWLDGKFKTKKGKGPVLSPGQRTQINFRAISKQFRSSLAEQLELYYYERLENRGTDLDADLEK